VARIAASLGHPIVPPVPSLFTFDVKDDPRLVGLAGLAVKDVEVKLVPSAGKLTLVFPRYRDACLRIRPEHHSFGFGDAVCPKPKPPQRGPMLITHNGLSGPAVLRTSSFSARELQELG
jgi:predicted flavoprotein YhiN